MKKLLSIVLILVLCLSLFACIDRKKIRITTTTTTTITTTNQKNSTEPSTSDSTRPRFRYSSVDGGISIDGLIGSPVGDIVIPETLNGELVVAIGAYAFKNYNKMKGVTIPKGIKSIGKGAFDECSNLKNVYITDIEAWCNIDFEYQHPESYGIDFGLSANPMCYAEFLYVNGVKFAADGILTIPEGIKKINNGAFAHFDRITKIEFPDNLTHIGIGAFYGCESLTELTIPDSVINIGDKAFLGCKSIASITIPADTKLGSRVFSECSGLQTATFANGTTDIPTGTFEDCGKLTTVIIPGSVKTIGSYAFSACNGLESITIPYGVKTIYFAAFSKCNNLTSIDIPNSVTSIGDWVFEDCNNVVIYANANSYAYQYAKANNIRVISWG